MQLALLHLLGGILVLYLGGELLVRGSVAVAARFGVRPLVAGLTIVAFGTSAPELAVTLDAALEGYNDVAVGNVVGSNICNIALILGLSALISPVRVDPRLFRLDIPLMVVAAVVLVGLLSDDALSRAEGFGLFLAIVGYVLFHLWLARTGRSDADVVEGAVATEPARGWLHPAMIVAGLAALMAGGYLVVHGGVELAKGLGVSNAVVALTVVAVGTSLPELSTSIVAAARKQGDIALGNVVGSNIFNVFAILGTTAIVHPLVRGGVGWDALGTMVAVSLLLVPLAASGLRLGRREGALLLASYVGYCAWAFAP